MAIKKSAWSLIIKMIIAAVSVLAGAVGSQAMNALH